MEDELQLPELVDIAVLQRIQDAFSELTGMAALTTDANGVPVTKGSNFTDFCMKYVRKTPIGNTRCEECDRYGAHETWQNGKATTYRCHAGLIDYAAPIIADGKLVGCFIGGQVLTEGPDFEKIEKVASDIGVDCAELFLAACKVHILDKESVEHAAYFLDVIANTLSDMAYGKYLALQANVEIERAANMKTDFLANMSHEIRTPMNAVIGMAEMALRESLPPLARDYVSQIKSSAKTLLTIINDILDFSKIESGKMDIIPVEYEPLSIVNDTSNILLTRMKGKDVELILDISPRIPCRLYGDNIRIEQILLNLANNAVKFTSKGQVIVHMSHEEKSDDEIILHVAVEDSGIGIKKENLEQIFESFHQVDSKRNRNIEGTGLGLAISQRLVALMNGELQVESEYEKGSIFSFSLPQKVVDPRECIQVKEQKSIYAAGILKSDLLKRQLKTDCTNLGVAYQELNTIQELVVDTEKQAVFLFMEQNSFTADVEEYIIHNPSVTAVLLIDFRDETEFHFQNLLAVKKPLYALNLSMIFNREDLRYCDEDVEVEVDFIAPTAEILIVDDNAVNLTVAEGLLEPLKMKVDTAESGKEAIAKISKHHYDLIFMDHMMPEVDGVETTRIIRRFHQEYHDVPIIALTANAVDGVKEMFLDEGMNDFVAKPIELKNMIAKVKQWLPVEKIQRIGILQSASQRMTSTEEIVIGDLDTRSAIRLLGSEKLFWTVLKEYYRVIDKKSKTIKELMEKEAWGDYTIEVHALKSASRQIGATALAEKAAALERAGNARDTAQIRRDTDMMLNHYRGYIAILEPYFAEEDKDGGQKQPIPTDLLFELFTEMRDALEDLDFARVEKAIQTMEEYRYDGWQKELFVRLREYSEDMDVDGCEEIIEQWEDNGGIF
jgi:signal transduction histidine kinase/CheY-like chemotaxis protein/HPt (histidine-containing phosphotransfer) domain-containing protein